MKQSLTRRLQTHRLVKEENPNGEALLVLSGEARAGEFLSIRPKTSINPTPSSNKSIVAKTPEVLDSEDTASEASQFSNRFYKSRRRAGSDQARRSQRKSQQQLVRLSEQLGPNAPRDGSRRLNLSHPLVAAKLGFTGLEVFNGSLGDLQIQDMKTSSSFTNGTNPRQHKASPSGGWEHDLMPTLMPTQRQFDYNFRNDRLPLWEKHRKAMVWLHILGHWREDTFQAEDYILNTVALGEIENLYKRECRSARLIMLNRSTIRRNEVFPGMNLVIAAGRGWVAIARNLCRDRHYYRRCIISVDMPHRLHVRQLGEIGIIETVLGK